MNYQDILKRLRKFEKDYYNCSWGKELSDDERKKLKKEIIIQYGELESIILRFTGMQNIKVTSPRYPTAIFTNHIEASLLSPSYHDASTPYNQILKVLGQVQQLSKDPIVPKNEYSLTNLIQILLRFRECCQYVKEAPKSEKAVQDIIWIMLRSQFDRIEREETLPKFGVKNYRPDFGIPNLQVLLEVKFIGEKTQLPKIQEEILADIPGYLSDSANYHSIIILVYDDSQKLRDPRKFKEDICSVEGIMDVLVIPGIS